MPTRRLITEDIPEAEESAAAVEPPEPTIALASGEALARDNVSNLQRRNVSRSIGLIGPNDSGKTSLIAGVYDLLQDGPLSGAAFAGSSTLIGFERFAISLVRSPDVPSRTQKELVAVRMQPSFISICIKKV